jgi:hypothetical protein
MMSATHTNRSYVHIEVEGVKGSSSGFAGPKQNTIPALPEREV